MAGKHRKQDEETFENTHSAGSKSSEHHHHHRKKSLWRRFKHRVKKLAYQKKWLLPTAFAAMALTIVLIWLGYSGYMEQKGSLLTAANQTNVGSGYRNIIYNGKEYHYNSRITTILYAGVDSEEELKPYVKYGFAPQADSISLVVMDEAAKKTTIIALNRDTMTPIHEYTLDGHDRGMFTNHLALAFTYGDNSKMSCWNLCKSVSDLFYGIPINEYVILNRSSLPSIAEIVGDVKVIVPNDELAMRGYHAGETAIIGIDNIETYVRYRDTNKDLSNVGRMERQRSYIDGAMGQITELLNKRPAAVWESMMAIEGCLLTNITRSQYFDLINTFNKCIEEEQQYYTPEGKQVVGEFYDEFYADEDALLAKVVEIFYREK